MFRLINVIIPKNELTLKNTYLRKKIDTDQAKFCEHELLFSKHELFSIIIFVNF